MPDRIHIAVAAVVLTATLLAGQVVAASDDTLALNGTAWTLADLPGHTLLPDPPVTLRFEQGRVYGSDGCNQYSAPYVADPGAFRLSGPIASTKMACPEPVMQQADAFLRALSNAHGGRIDDGRLVLLDASGAILATLTAQSQDLPGTTWRVTAYNNGKQAVVSILAGSTLTMAFSADGTLGGSAGCNRYTAAYTASGQALTIGKVATTRKLCARPTGVMEQESAFLRALAMVAVARVEGNRLELRSDGGALAVTAVRSANGAEAGRRRR